MLLNLKIKNWLSYRDEASLNLLATQERQHSEHLTPIPKFRSKKVLPLAAIYGGNASGKTAIFHALNCLKTMVTQAVEIDEALPVLPFLLTGEKTMPPVSLEITFLAEGTVYRLAIEATNWEIMHESLEILRGNGKAVNLYERNATDNQEQVYSFNARFFEDATRVDFVFKGTLKNQLFINSAVRQNINVLRPVYDWFDKILSLVSVESQAQAFARCCVEKNDFLEYAGNMLSRLDTGIVGFYADPVDESALPQNESVQRDLSQLKEGDLLVFISEHPGDYNFNMHIAQRVGGQLQVDRLVTEHQTTKGKPTRFELSRESSGTRRLMQLLPMFYNLLQVDDFSEHVYIVDELDRSFHTMLTEQLIQDFLETCGGHLKRQLLFSTHDLLLMNQEYLRRDEMYITQRDKEGCSQLIGLSEFEGIRKDKDLIRSYLDGRFGGIPMLRRTEVPREQE